MKTLLIMCVLVRVSQELNFGKDYWKPLLDASKQTIKYIPFMYGMHLLHF